jgi:DNA-binding MarR family transcriptional regulator
MNDLKLDDVFIYLIERTQRQMRRYSNAALKQAGIDLNSDQWVILKRISENEALNQREIADLTFKDTAAITRSLDILEERNLVKRQDVPNDRRAYQLVLTPAGEELVAKVIPIAQLVRSQGLQGINEEELRHFKNVLAKIYTNYS